MVAVDCWAERLVDSGGSVGWLWLAMAIEWLGCAVMGVGWKLVLGAGDSWAVGDAELVTWVGAVGVIGGADW